MIDPDRFAALLCDWCLEVAPGQQIIVGSTSLAEPLLDALHAAILERDAWPVMRMTSPAWEPGFYRHARPRHLDAHSAHDLLDAETADASLRIDAPRNGAALAGVDPALIARRARALQPVQAARSARRWAFTLWPTPSLAQAAGMAEEDYGAFVERALFLDREDPVAAWRELSQRQARLAARLGNARTVRIEAEGTDITLDVADRTWINSDGRRNMPSGEVFTGPHERSANGTIRFTVPTGPRGVTVTGVELTFRDGEVVAARADQGQPYLDSALATDEGARRLGEIGIGTNPGIDVPTGHILLDEKMAGTVHLALGRSYPETGGTNESAVHWDLICDLRAGGSISVDGETLELEIALGGR
ncbi:MAG TPA: aminopeptidase [Solirubrobacteraceae bacterium]|nr:aminopeptidase [Solirubrobacteraceae bacterium]